MCIRLFVQSWKTRCKWAMLPPRARLRNLQGLVGLMMGAAGAMCGVFLGVAGSGQVGTGSRRLSVPQRISPIPCDF